MSAIDINIEDARSLFPATGRLAYFNTAAVSLGSTALEAAYTTLIDDWTRSGFDFARGEQAGENARAAFAAVVGARVEDIALIPSVSAAAGLIASQFGPAERGENILIGEREYSSNHFPWRMLEHKGYELRITPFRNGGLEPDDVAERSDEGTRLIAFSAVQTASGHLTDVPAMTQIARRVGAWTFVDGAQAAGALPVAHYLEDIDFFVAPNHKFLLNAARGMGYCFINRRVRDSLVPTCAGWKAGAVPFDSFFGPEMTLSPTASRFDNSPAWMAAVGDEAALSLFDRFGPDALFARNRQLVSELRERLTDVGISTDVPPANESTIVAIPIGGEDPGTLLERLSDAGVVCSLRDGHLRAAIHFYNNADDLDRLVSGLRGR